MADQLKTILDMGAVKAAEKLIGWHLYKRENDGTLNGGMIVETEAYTSSDAASHSFNGKTPRNAMMFGESGVAYIYLSYGMHWCLNVVTGKDGEGEAVLIRAIRIDKGIEAIKERRNNIQDKLLTNGPAKLCQALNISKKHNGLRFNESELVLIPPIQNSNIKTVATTRIGITKDTDRLWRFLIKS